MVARPIEKITALPPTVRPARLLDLDALDKLSLMNEEPISIEKAAELLGVGKQKVAEFCKEKEFPLPHDLLAGEYVFYPTLVRWWRLNRQKVK